jgi:CelD/BcsL family acetyltransferase involved in cellulose biosynthesis
MAIEIEEVRSMDHLAGMSHTWEEILATSGEDRLFLSLPWLRSWWKCYGEGREMCVLRAVENDRTVGFAPFMTTSRGRIDHWKKVEFIGSGPSDRCGIIAVDGRPDVHHVIWDYLREHLDWDVVELRDMLAGGPTESVVRACFPAAEFAASLSPHIVLADSYEHYLDGLSKNMRVNLKRYSRKLEEKGAVFRSLRSPEEVTEGVRTLKELSDARWEIANVLKLPRRVEFVEEASRELSKRRAVVFHLLEMEGRTAAITMGFEEGGRYLYYLSGFDPEMAKFSPGSELLAKIIQECIGRRMIEVDLLRGNEPYKYRFNAVDRVQSHFRAVNRGLLRTARCAIRETPLS